MIPVVDYFASKQLTEGWIFVGKKALSRTRVALWSVEMVWCLAYHPSEESMLESPLPPPPAGTAL